MHVSVAASLLRLGSEAVRLTVSISMRTMSRSEWRVSAHRTASIGALSARKSFSQFFHRRHISSCSEMPMIPFEVRSIDMRDPMLLAPGFVAQTANSSAFGVSQLELALLRLDVIQSGVVDHCRGHLYARGPSQQSIESLTESLSVLGIAA